MHATKNNHVEEADEADVAGCVAFSATIDSNKLRKNVSLNVDASYV